MIYYLSELPPSVNAMYAQEGKQRFKSREYNIWILKARRELYRCVPYECKKFSCDVRVPFCMKTKGDIDNRGKAILDTFVQNKLIPDDRHCLDFRIRYVKQTAGNKIEVEFNTADEELLIN